MATLLDYRAPGWSGRWCLPATGQHKWCCKREWDQDNHGKKGKRDRSFAESVQGDEGTDSQDDPIADFPCEGDIM
jgi:hypothetical protein